MSEIAKPRPSKRLGVRITAGILSATMVVSLAVNAAVAVRISPADAANAATNYLVENTEYVNQALLERIASKLNTAMNEPMTLEDHYNLAGTQIAEEKYEDALLSIKNCIALFDENQTQELYLDLLLKKGCIEVLLEKYDEAKITLEGVLLIHPEQMEVHLIMAQIHAQSGDLDSLEESLESYLDEVPDDNEVRSLLAQTLFAKEDFVSAKEEYAAIIESDDGNENVDMAQVHYMYALTNLQTENYDIALENLEAALGMDDSITDAYYYIGICRMSSEEYTLAVESFTKAIEAKSMVQLSYYSRGVSSLMIEDFDVNKALEDLKQTEVYNASDADAQISKQAAELIKELEKTGFEIKPESEIKIETQVNSNNE